MWDVVSELVCLCTIPSPTNPFALDMRYIKNLPLPERFLVTGALLNFLEMYVVYGNRDELHYDRGRTPWRAFTPKLRAACPTATKCIVLILLRDQQVVLFSCFTTGSAMQPRLPQEVIRITEFSPFSGGGGEASEASPRPVPAGGAAAQRGLRVDHQRSHCAGPFWSGPTVTVRMRCHPECTLTERKTANRFKYVKSH